VIKIIGSGVYKWRGGMGAVAGVFGLLIPK
jgi:hypothetical protein